MTDRTHFCVALTLPKGGDTTLLSLVVHLAHPSGYPGRESLQRRVWHNRYRRFFPHLRRGRSKKKVAGGAHYDVQVHWGTSILCLDWYARIVWFGLALNEYDKATLWDVL
jgi:hypothetical protein